MGQALSKTAKIALLFLLAALAQAQQPPGSACDFNGFDVSSQLAEVKAATTAYYACATGKCLPMRLRPDDPVVLNRTEGDWTCGYLVTRDGSAQGWVRSNDLRPVAIDPKPASTAWLGTWVQDENRIAVMACSPGSPATLTFDAKASWHGPGNNIHTGQVSVRARPVGNRVQLDDQLCKIDLVLAGRYLIANDNNLCGGLNVRFWGVWKRSLRATPAFCG